MPAPFLDEEDSPVLPLVPDSLSEPEARASMLGDVTCHIKSCSIRFDSKQEPTVCARCSVGLVAGCCKNESLAVNRKNQWILLVSVCRGWARARRGPTPRV
jgi:hypothetical protein